MIESFRKAYICPGFQSLLLTNIRLSFGLKSQDAYICPINRKEFP